MNRLLFLLFIFPFSILSYAQTPVQGGIYSNTTWTLANSPYILSGSVVVFPGNTLTIEPGVEIKVTADLTFNTGNMLYIEVRGALVALGTQNSPITFTSTQADQSTYNWLGIKILGSQGANFSMDWFILTNSFYGLYNDIPEVGVTHTFNGCIFRDNNYAIQLNANNVYNNCAFQRNGVGQAAQYVYGSLTANNSVFTDNICAFTWVYSGVNVSNCTFTGNMNTINGVAGTITNCSFQNNTNGLYGCSGLTIDNCTFTNNDMAVNDLSFGMVKNSIFTNNNIALLISQNTSVIDNVINSNQIGLKVNGINPNSIFINNNRICYNSQYNIENGTNQNFSVALNCFCSNDSSVVEDLIFDGYDDITKGLVNFSLFDDSCNVMLSFVQKIDLGENYNLGIPENAVSTIDFQYLGDYLFFKSAKPIKSIKIRNITGSEIAETSMTNGSGKTKVNHLASGIYFIVPDNGQTIKWYKP